jgi:PIN domain nuclease of toxin-antitoxin system
MKLLVDTHIYLWFIDGDRRLPFDIAEEIRNEDNDVFLSVASVWEIIVKYKIGKLPLPDAPEVLIPAQRELHGISSLPLDEAAVKRLAQLPPIHNDPFDRMLICQALEHGLTLVTLDTEIRKYTVSLLPSIDDEDKE